MPAPPAERRSPISNMSPKNPYSLILNLPEDVHSPDYYQLLGIARFATDRAMIRNAAMDQNRKLMMWQNNDEYYPIVKRLMHEIATALAVLTTEEKRNAYDRNLQTRNSTKDRESVDLRPSPPEEEVIFEFEPVAAGGEAILEFDPV